MELFLYGDPRFLAGAQGTNRASRGSYESAPPVIRPEDGHTTAALEAVHKMDPRDPRALKAAVGSVGEHVHEGKGSYHSTPPQNRFLVEGQWPSAGIELETICSAYNSTHYSRLVSDLPSNWFHFERDGSLDEDHGGEYGFELVTDPLPPRVYRDPRTWIGLENILSPWLESFDHSETGLHVHVGLNQFMDFDAIPIKDREARMYIAKVMCMFVYYAVADAAFVDRVCLRKPTRYCGTPGGRQLFDGCSRLASGAMTGYEFIDLAISKLLLQNTGSWHSRVNEAASYVASGREGPAFCNGVVLDCTTSHGVEINTEHRYTIEFRRAKGTLHALSVHRVVELMTLIVRYAGRCCRNPEEKVSSQAFYKFVHDNTTSMPLKKLVERATGADAASR